MSDNVPNSEHSQSADGDTSDTELNSDLSALSAANDDVGGGSNAIILETQRRQTLEWLTQIIAPRAIIEVFVKNAFGMGRHLSGFYDADHLDALVQQTIGVFSAPAAVYFRINPIRPNLLQRAPSELRSAAEVKSSRSEDIACRRRIMIDLDPIRSDKRTGCATNEEKHFALLKLEEVLDFLHELKWQPEAIIDTGNGFCIYIRVDLSTDDQGLVKKFLATLARMFDDERVCVDRSVHDAMRLGRVPGTWNCKGENTEDRPHRLCQIISVADDSDITVTRSQIEGLLELQSPSTSGLT